MDRPDLHWQAKLAAWIHDPAEKALVLLRDPAGHEGGTVAALKQAVFGGESPAELIKHVKRADHWAAAADRPQFPKGERDGRYPAWTQVNFAEQSQLIHPLSGERYTLDKLNIEAWHIRAVSTDHFRSLIVPDNDTIDFRRTALAFWRFGPETPAAGLGELWGLLPADTRVPDHTIWTHLDLSSAFTTAFALDMEHNPALLTMSFGPVQDFIAQARTTSDLWAGSHLLSRIAWEGLKVICEELGPDAVLFPQLRGVPQVDLWLREEVGLPKALFGEADWANDPTDANPLFAAALPNRFVAIVPADQAEGLAARVTEAVRDWIHERAEEMFGMLLEVAGIPDDPAHYAYKQIAEQLRGFPEMHWAAAPFQPLVMERQGETLDATALANGLAYFHPTKDGEAPGFLGSNNWRLLSRELKTEGAVFYRPNPGALYPALYDLLDKVQGAAKGVRPFAQTRQEGYRCSLSGEAEWLTTDRAQLMLPPGQRKNTLWARVAEKRPAWARKGEHLGALATLKRLWPTWFAKELREKLDLDVRRYVVSTHTMALATTLERWLDGRSGHNDPRDEDLFRLSALVSGADRAALPKRLADELRHRYARDAEHPVRMIAERLPVRLDELRDAGDETSLAALAGLTSKVLGANPETYYALILLDGDRMGAWLSGAGKDGERYRLPYRATWHSQIAVRLDRDLHFQGADLKAYLNERRAVSPARHMAISGALNAFALQLARHVVEDLCKGKLIYAGGDDVMAMVAVDDLLAALLLLRLAYAGVFPPDAEAAWQLLGIEPKARYGLSRLGNGHALFDGRLLRLMGHLATASAGAVVAHHQAPLGTVLRELRATEKDAKSAGRDAFAIRLLKRSGGAIRLAAPWLEPCGDWSRLRTEDLRRGPIGLLLELRRAFSGEGFSRRAAYLTQGWIEDLPPRSALGADGYADLLAASLGYQFKRQGGDSRLGRELGKLAVALTSGHKPDNLLEDPALDLVRNLLAVAEFLAREGRVDEPRKTSEVA